MSVNKKVLVVGSGGREHALCWKLAASPRIEKLYVAPGSAGIGRLNKTEIVSKLNIKDFKEVTTWCKSNGIDLVAVGPEDPLALGLADALSAENIACFGPSRDGARIEADKDWSKAFMVKHGIPTARYQSFTDAEAAKQFIRSAPFKAWVVKASGLAAGKGVTVANNNDEACAAVDEMLGDKKFGSAGDTVVIEELLSGEEVSVLAFTDGNTVKTMLPAQDHKRLLDNDKGPNTGGMGAYCPCPLISATDLEIVEKTVLKAAVEGLKKEGIKYCGVLYAGMMLTPDGPKTLEFNCRFGDPETQVLMPMLDSDLFTIMEACCNRTLSNVEIKWKNGVNAVGVVMASKGYPETSTKGSVITGIEKVENREKHVVFHSGIACTPEGNGFATNGGRVLIVVVTDPDCKKASEIATQSCKDITFDGAQFRKDIAHKSFMQIGLSYKDSGVDIDAGDHLVQKIKPMAKSTNRPGVLGGLGGFGGLFKLNEVYYSNKNGTKTPYKDPVLVQGADGVGTKLKIAEETGVYDTIGIDLVAMCVNDVLCAGAEPLAFLDYLACGKLDVNVTASIVSGIASACRETRCALLGGETAEMPSMYKPGKYDMAGFCVGVVDYDDMLPRVDSITPGDLVIGLPSSGVHSNGFSLVHRIMKLVGMKYNDVAPWSAQGHTFGSELLTPTRLYVSQVLPIIRHGYVKAIAHITGGGLLENIPRVLPDNVRVTLDAHTWTVPPMFGWLCKMGHLSDAEMLRTLNCGIGMVLIVPTEYGTNVLTSLKSHGGCLIGKIETRTSTNPQQVVVNNFREVIDKAGANYQNTANISSGLSYKDSGVDIEAGELLVTNIKPLCRSTNRPGVIGGLGGFGGLFRVKEATYLRNGVETHYKDPVLVMGTDGVGTKLKIAQEIDIHDTIGIDLVAMCANDILCNGAEPLTFLDYYACGKLDVKVAAKVLDGISEGCRQSGSALIGGETAEMPGMYDIGVYDLAGYSLGIVENEHMLPNISLIKPGDILIGLPSAGVHSNGFSLVHKVLEKAGLTIRDAAPFSKCGKSLGEELLTPTKMYISSVLPALRTGLVKALAHITGGGLLENIPRVLPPHLQVVLNANDWNIPPVFAWLYQTGNIQEHEMLRTFNCGLGMVLVVPKESEMEIFAQVYGHGATKIGEVRERIGDSSQVIVENFKNNITRVVKTLTIKKKVAVLISGTGSNLQALIDSSRDSSSGLGVEIVLVISNKPEALGIEKAQRAGIPTKVIKHKDYPTRVEYDMTMHEELKKAGVEFICLAGFMRILSVEFVRLWKGKMINVHPSLLPKYKGTDGIKQAFESGDKYTGCTVHFVDEGLDSGAILVQEVVHILPNDTLETLSARVHKVEHLAFPRALRMLATNAVSLDENGTLLKI